jgi:DNA-binding NarL/FixJ family response regulator
MGSARVGAAHSYEGLLLLDALALFRDGHPEGGLRCIQQLQRSRNLNELVNLLCPGFALHRDRRAQRIRRVILDPANEGGEAGSMAESVSADSVRMIPPLTIRQQAVLGLVRDGLTNRQIARRLLISENTVKWHLKALARQLGASNRCSMIGIAERRRLIPSRVAAWP